MARFFGSGKESGEPSTPPAIVARGYTALQAAGAAYEPLASPSPSLTGTLNLWYIAHAVL